jgi:HSP20 family protein
MRCPRKRASPARDTGMNAMNRNLSPFFQRRQDADYFFPLRSEIDRLFEDFGRLNVGGRAAPRIDVCETDRAIEIDAELPGYREDQVDLTLEGRTLLLRGEYGEERADEKRDWHVRERSMGAFARRIELPFAADPESIEATFKNGVLRVIVLKPDRSKGGPARIAISGAGAPQASAGGRSPEVQQPGPDLGAPMKDMTGESAADSARH